jgi:DNA-binding GntR family transcriptional regulator
MHPALPLVRAIGTEEQMDQPNQDKPQSLTEQAYELLRREIITCSLAPGADVSEAELAERLQMSKTPVRDALARLRTDGFVETFPRRGYRIVPMTLADMNELIDVRIVIESGTAALAAKRITDTELDELDRLADITYDLDQTLSLDQFIGANRQFHSAIARAAGRDRLYSLVSRNLDELERFFYLGARIRDVNPETQSDHHRIVSVLRRRDPVAAGEILTIHNEVTRAGLLAGIASGRSMEALRVA